MKYAKRICYLVCVILMCINLIAAPSAYAAGTPLLGGQQFGALIASGLLSLNIIANTALQSQPIQKLWDWCSSPTAQDRIDYLFPNSSAIISDYMNAATIKVNQGVVTIDGVEYDELWVSPGTFTNGLKTNLFDFKTKWAILSGSAGTLATGSGYVGNTPIYTVDGKLISQKVSVPGEGSYSLPGGLSSVYANGYSDIYAPTTDGMLRFAGGQTPDSLYPIEEGLEVRDTTIYYSQIRSDGRNILILLPANYLYSYDGSPFDFTYISGVVPAEESDIPNDYGLSLKIPHDKLQTFYNTFPQYNIDNTTINIQQDQVDIDQLTQSIFDMIDSMEDMKAEWTNGEEPEPPTPVDPIENIDQNVQDISDYQQDMQQQVEHMHQDVEAIHQTQQQQKQIEQQMQQTQQQMKQSTDSIDNTIKDIKNTLEPGEITEKTFDLRELFPFCIPFDIYHLLQKFDGTPTAPHVQLPIVIPSIGFSYTMDLDFSAWDPVASAMRTVELIVYALGLAWATSKVIKW